MAMIRVAALSAILLAAAGAAPAPVPVYKEFGDWVVACDNVRSCTAHAVPDPGGAADIDAAQKDATLWLTWDAGRDALPSVQFGGDRPGLPVGTSVDGQAVPGLTWTASGPATAGTATVTGSKATDLLRQIRDGRTLTLTPPGGPVSISLQGLAASLLLFDDVQGRIGTVTALARPGPLGADTVPAAPALPLVRAAHAAPPLRNRGVFAAAVRRSQAAALKAHDCDTGVADDDEADPLDDGEALVILVCNRAAYQEDSLVFRAPRTAPAKAWLVHLPTPPGAPRAAKDSDADLITGTSYDPAKAELSEFAKARGVGDCGISATWTFDGGGFQPSAYASQDRCGGQPGEWPMLFRTRRAP